MGFIESIQQLGNVGLLVRTKKSTENNKPVSECLHTLGDLDLVTLVTEVNEYTLIAQVFTQKGYKRWGDGSQVSDGYTWIRYYRTERGAWGTTIDKARGVRMNDPIRALKNALASVGVEDPDKYIKEHSTEQ